MLRKDVKSLLEQLQICIFAEIVFGVRCTLIFLQISSLTSMKKLKNLLELPNPTRNTRKFANKLITDTFGEINLQSKQYIISHVAKVKPTCQHILWLT